MKKLMLSFACVLMVIMATSCVKNINSNHNSAPALSEASVSIINTPDSINTASSKTDSLPTSSLNENSEIYNLKFYISLMSMGIYNWFISTADTENWVQISLTHYCSNEDAHKMRGIKSVSINYPYDFDETTVWKLKIVIDDSFEENPVSPTYVINDIIIKGTDPLIQVDNIYGTGFTAICGQLDRCDQCGKPLTVVK